MAGHAGFYACPVCECRGETWKNPDKSGSHKVVYPSGTIQSVQRSDDEIRAATRTPGYSGNDADFKKGILVRD